jgi:hypothetical protein
MLYVLHGLIYFSVMIILHHASLPCMSRVIISCFAATGVLSKIIYSPAIYSYPNRITNLTQVNRLDLNYVLTYNTHCWLSDSRDPAFHPQEIRPVVICRSDEPRWPVPLATESCTIIYINHTCIDVTRCLKYIHSLLTCSILSTWFSHYLKRLFRGQLDAAASVAIITLILIISVRKFSDSLTGFPTPKS